ncbi:MAG: ABC transporter permease [Acidimicrobiaceae bacterium]|nr:ABC transporter permease [Acidimicrobiaceae bacterium]
MSFLVNVLEAMLRVSTPLALGSSGEVVTERSGVLNLGIEGTMYAGAFFGFYAAYQTDSRWVGLAVAIAVGALAGALLSFLVVTLGVNQHTAGLGMTIFLIGTSEFVNRAALGTGFGTSLKVETFGVIKPFGLGGIAAQYGMTYVTLLIVVPCLWWMLRHTSLGLAITAVGENPEAADVAGINVKLTRYIALIIGGMLMAAGGAFLTLATLGSFTLDIIAGRGWVCLALVIFGRWGVFRALAGGLLFSFVYALQFRLRLLDAWQGVPFELLLALPYLITIVALVASGRNAKYPGAYLKPYRRA